MSLANQHFEPQYERRARVLELMQNIERLISGMPSTGHASTELRDSWVSLVKSLALEAEPELRECPHCGAVGMAAATRCGRCWARLAPLVAVRSSPREKPGGVTES